MEKGSVKTMLIQTGLVFVALTAAVVAAHHINHHVIGTATLIAPKPADSEKG